MNSTLIAVAYGALDCLKYIYEKNILPYYYTYDYRPMWNSSLCVIAAENGHIDCLKYLHINGCVLTKGALKVATPQCFEYIVKFESILVGI